MVVPQDQSIVRCRTCGHALLLDDDKNLVFENENLSVDRTAIDLASILIDENSDGEITRFR